MSNAVFVLLLGGFLFSVAFSTLKIRDMTKIEEEDYSAGITETSRDPVNGEQ
jgi:hypothetical protein